MKQIIIFGMLIFLFDFGLANSIQINGKVVDNETGEALIFVNIGIEGTLVGTASDAQGEFSLKIPNEHQDKNLYFSAIGYENLILLANSFIDGSSVKLQALSYGIGDIEISTQSKVLYKIVRNAAQAVDEHFIDVPYNYELLYRDEKIKGDSLFRKRNATVLLSDAEGYDNKQNTHASVNYQFKNVERNFEVRGLEDGTTMMDDLLMYDFARNRGNILDVNYLNEYDLELVDETKLLHDSVWVIGFKLSDTDFTKTGSLYTQSYEGKLYVGKTNNVVLKVEANGTASQINSFGKNLAVDEQVANIEVKYHVTTTYRKMDKSYCLDGVMINSSYQNTEKEAVSQQSSIMVLNVETASPILIKNRQYFEDLVSDPDFWIGIKK